MIQTLIESMIIADQNAANKYFTKIPVHLMKLKE